MKLEHKQLEEIIFGKTGFRRFTQDSSVLPDVWMAFGTEPEKQFDLLLTPVWGTPPGTISKVIDQKLKAERKTPRWKARARPQGEAAEIAYNTSTVAIKLYFDEMIRVVLPVTKWWESYILDDPGKNFFRLVREKTFRDDLITALEDSVKKSDKSSGEKQIWDINYVVKHRAWGRKKPKRIEHLIWLIKIVGAIVLEDPDVKDDKILENVPTVVNTFVKLMTGIEEEPAKEEKGLVWAINRNRAASAMIWQSTTAVKADAARRLFEVKCDGIRWAIIDSGIDATHPAFRLRDADGKPAKKSFIKQKDNAVVNMTRIEKTFDFTLIRKILSRDQSSLKELPLRIRKRFKENPEERQTLQERLQQGRAVDWEFLAPLLQVSNENYKPPVFEHGTHVAGIIAADWKSTDDTNEKKINIQGVCPDLRLYDLRVLDENGESDEFSVLAALQFVQYLNSTSDFLQIHGVNLSLSIRHSVKNFACGCTPICEEAERLINSGIIVVAAAGNDGYLEAEMLGGMLSEGYRSISITDPGNAAGVITVGATHRDSPHTYGVSYFSSRGPTGDGRIKPDLVAPGEKITSTVPGNGLKTMDGTSMAAPHVSGAAALLIARYKELVGKPGRVKQILCDTATDLGRERYFQGSGMVDILRAMQSV